MARRPADGAHPLPHEGVGAVWDVVGWSDSGRAMAATASDDGHIRVWNLETAAQVGELSLDGGECQALWASPDGTLLLAGLRNGELWGWSPGMPAPSFTAKCHDDTIRGVAAALTPAGGVAVTGSRDGTVSATTLGDRRVFPLGRHGKSVTSIAVSPDGAFAVSGGRDHAVKVWDLLTRQERPSPASHGSDVHRVAVVDGRVVSIADDRTVATWQLGAADPAVNTFTLDRPALCMAVLPDHDVLVVGCLDNTVRALELPSLRQVASVTLESSVTCVSASGHPSQFCAGEASGEVHHFTLLRQLAPVPGEQSNPDPAPRSRGGVEPAGVLGAAT